MSSNLDPKFSHPAVPAGTTIHGSDHGANLVSRGSKDVAKTKTTYGLGYPTDVPRGDGGRLTRELAEEAARKVDKLVERYAGSAKPTQGKLWDGDTYLGDDGVSDETEVLDEQPCQDCFGDPEYVKICERCDGTGIDPELGIYQEDTMSSSTTVVAGGASKAYATTTTTPSYYYGATTSYMLWSSAKSIACANSSNVFVRMYGQFRDMKDNYFSCPERRHWGPRGGAGIIPLAFMDGHAMVLLSHRSAYVEQGNSWSSFGGAIDMTDKTPLDAATRETFEEVSGLPRTGNVVHKISRPCHACGWTYWTFVVELEAPVETLLDVHVTKGKHSWETEGVSWVPAWLVGRYKLHPGFEKSWPEVEEVIRELEASRAAAK